MLNRFENFEDAQLRMVFLKFSRDYESNDQQLFIILHLPTKRSSIMHEIMNGMIRI